MPRARTTFKWRGLKKYCGDCQTAPFDVWYNTQFRTYRIPVINEVRHSSRLVLLDGVLDHRRNNHPYIIATSHQGLQSQSGDQDTPKMPSPSIMGTAPATTRFIGDRDAEILTVYRNHFQSSSVTSYTTNGCGTAVAGGAISGKPLFRVLPLQNVDIGMKAAQGRAGGLRRKLGGGGSRSFSTLSPGASLLSADFFGIGDPGVDGAANIEVCKPGNGLTHRLVSRTTCKSRK